MGQQSGPAKEPTDQVIREIRRSSCGKLPPRGEDSHRPFASARQGHASMIESSTILSFTASRLCGRALDGSLAAFW